ncbi:MAG: AAA family ATPase [Candidatus Aenigmarchaeota archaeon]|nr:AAA family ATPase [Candidatus Aenigmarchaeota archaeon]
MIIVVSGVKGAGKSKVIEYVTKQKPMKVIRVGDYFEKVFKEKGLKRDEGDKVIRKREYVDIQKKVFKEIKNDLEEDTIIDTNLFFTKPGGFYPGLPAFALDIIKPDAIVLLEYKPEFILQRRNKDLKELGRERSAAFDIEGIKLEQEVQKHYAFICSELCQCTVKILKRYEPETYEFEHAEKNAEEILKIIK